MPRSDSKPNPSNVIEGEMIEDEGDLGGGAIVLAGQQNTQLRTTYTTAQLVKKSREVKNILKKCEDEFEIAGEDTFYSWTQGGKLIEGISIDGAMILARNYGNCVVEAQVVKDAPTFWIFDAVFVDLESGMTTSRQFRQRKGESHQSAGKGKNKDEDRLLDIAFQIGQSKAIRNVVLHAMPVWLKEKSRAAAKKGLEGKYANIAEWIDKALAAFGAKGVKKEEIETKLGKPTDLWTSGDIQLLLAVKRALDARETTVEIEFRTPAAGATAPGPTPPASSGAPPAASSKPADAPGVLDPSKPSTMFTEQPKTPAAEPAAAAATPAEPAATTPAEKSKEAEKPAEKPKADKPKAAERQPGEDG